MILSDGNYPLLFVIFKAALRKKLKSAAARGIEAPPAAALEDCKGDHPLCPPEAQIHLRQSPQQRFQNGRELRRMALALAVFKLENLGHLAAFPGGQLHEQQGKIPRIFDIWLV